MPHFGVLSYSGAGHLNALIALSRQLIVRGHRVTLFQRPEFEARARQGGIDFYPIVGLQRYKRPTHTNSNQTILGISDLRFRINRITDEIERSLTEIPSAISNTGIDALIIDEIVLAGPTLAQFFQLPYFVISTSVPHNFGWTVPRSLSQSDTPRSYVSRLHTALLQASVFRMRGPVRWKLDKGRQQLGLGPARSQLKVYPPLAHIGTLPACLDFTRHLLPRNFHYTGPFVDESIPPSIVFPWHLLDERPMIYVSLGTSRKIRSDVFRLIAQACDGLGMQVVMSLGGSRSPETLEGLPGNPLIVREAPQLDLIRRSTIVINHAGINTVMETLMDGKPMVSIPITHDQPAMAARLAWLKIAEVIPLSKLSSDLLRLALVKVLSNSSYRDAAQRMQRQIQSDQGLEKAAKIIHGELGAYQARQVRSHSPRFQVSLDDTKVTNQ